MNRAVVIGCIAAATAWLGACQQLEFKGGGNGDQTAASAEPFDWPYRPVAMRVHPFTAVRADEQGRPVLDARIEFLDRDGDAAKAAGELRFELYSDDATAARQGRQQRLEQWQVSITSLEANRQHWDVTRTYAFKLRLPQQPPKNRKLVLNVQLTDPLGRRLLASASVYYDPDRPGSEG